MQIVFDRKAAEELRERYTVLELETFKAGELGESITAFCVVPAEKLASVGMSTLDEQIENHNAFLSATKAEQWKLILAIHNTVCGQFGGELDSFYESILDRATLRMGYKNDV